MLGWLNPLNWIKLISLAKSLFDGVVSIFKYFQAKKIKQDQDNQVDVISKIEMELNEASKIKDEDARLKAKANAIKKLEETISSRP